MRPVSVSRATWPRRELTDPLPRACTRSSAVGWSPGNRLAGSRRYRSAFGCVGQGEDRRTDDVGAAQASRVEFQAGVLVGETRVQIVEPDAASWIGGAQPGPERRAQCLGDTSRRDSPSRVEADCRLRSSNRQRRRGGLVCGHFLENPTQSRYPMQRRRPARSDHKVCASSLSYDTLQQWAYTRESRVSQDVANSTRWSYARSAN